VEQYRTVRKAWRDGEKGPPPAGSHYKGDDCFHVDGKISPAVLDWHQYLRHGVRKYDTATPRILDLVERKMLLSSAKARLSSKLLEAELDKILDEAAECIPDDYQPPTYFRWAFEDDQKRATEEYSNPRPKTDSRRTNRYKTMRLQNLPGAGPGGPDGVHIPLLTALAEKSAAANAAASRNGSPGPKNQNRARPDYDHWLPSKADPASGDNKGHLGYWDALYLLEHKGWINDGTLMRRREPAPASLSPPVPAMKRTGSIYNPMIFFERRRSNKTLLLSRSKSTTATSKPQLSNSGFGKVDEDLKTKALIQYFETRDIVSAPFPNCCRYMLT